MSSSLQNKKSSASGTVETPLQQTPLPADAASQETDEADPFPGPAVSLKEALERSSRACAFTDLAEDFQAERQGDWVKILHVVNDPDRKLEDPRGAIQSSRYFSFNSLAEAEAWTKKNGPHGWWPLRTT